MTIENETSKKLLEWYEDEVKIHHYDPVKTPLRAPYALDALRDELLRRLEKLDYYNI